MIRLTEAELLSMRQVQTKYMENRSDFNAMGPFTIEAIQDWPRLTEWALEARRLLAIILDNPGVKHLDFEDGSPWIRIHVNEAWVQEVRRLLGE